MHVKGQEALKILEAIGNQSRKIDKTADPSTLARELLDLSTLLQSLNDVVSGFDLAVREGDMEAGETIEMLGPEIYERMNALFPMKERIVRLRDESLEFYKSDHKDVLKAKVIH